MPEPRAERPLDPAYVEAPAALAARHPLVAESLLGPVLGDPARRTSHAVLLAARAAAAHDQWARVNALLEMPLPETGPATDARLLLARGALELGNASNALAHARLAGTIAPDDERRARALVLFARAEERLGARGQAKNAWITAAKDLPDVADWLLLRAAALEPDRAARERLYEKVDGTTARARVPYAEAQTLERTGGARRAIPLYEQAGAPMHAMRLRAALASGHDERVQVRRMLVGFVHAHSGSDEAQHAIEMLDEARLALSPLENLIVARSAMVHGPRSRARTALEQAMAGGSSDARLLLAELYADDDAAGRRRADKLLATIPPRSPLAPRAALLRATVLRRQGRLAAARTAFQRVVARWPKDTAASSGALLALAEMATDERRDDAALDAWRTLARRYPTSAATPRAHFEAGVLAFAARRFVVASLALDSAAARLAGTSERFAARYWSGRARLALRDSAGARERWQPMLDGQYTYYAGLAARRVEGEPWFVTAAPDTFTDFDDVREAVARAELLEELGMSFEARLELDGISTSADSSVEHVLAAANTFRRRGQMRRAMALGRRALALGADDARAWRLVYPLDDARLVADEAARNHEDPALVAAVIRHESSFEPWATSPAGARGLMQVMPRIGAALARAEGITPWEPGLLYDPAMNVRLGVLHLKAFTGHYRHPAFALAAYNAGQGRVARWAGRRGGRDPELFVERIRFPETRAYVRDVLVSRDMYAALYDWTRLGASGTPAASAGP